MEAREQLGDRVDVYDHEVQEREFEIVVVEEPVMGVLLYDDVEY